MRKCIGAVMAVFAAAVICGGCSGDKELRDEVAQLRKDVDALRAEVKSVSHRRGPSVMPQQGPVSPEEAKKRAEAMRQRGPRMSRDELAKLTPEERKARFEEHRRQRMERGQNTGPLTPEERKARMEERRREHEERRAEAAKRRAERAAEKGEPAQKEAAAPEVPAAPPAAEPAAPQGE